MTERPPSHPELLDVLRTAPLGVPTPNEIELERERLLPWLTRQVADLPAVQARAKRQARLRWLGGGAALFAAAAAIVLVVGSLSVGSAPSEEAAFATLVSGSLESDKLELLPGSRLGLSSQVRASDSAPAVLTASSGYRVELSPRSEMEFVQPTSTRTSLRLLDGEVALSVPKLRSGQVLEVQTMDATVRVRGTRFSVRFDSTAAVARTCVRVTEGLVEVDRVGETISLVPGQSSGCETVAPKAPAALAPGRPRELAVQKAAKTSLGEENRLLALALSHERAGRRAEARKSYEELQRRFPESRFLPEARAGLARLVTAPQGP